MTESLELLAACLMSEAEADRNRDPANVVDGLFAIARALERIAAVMEKRHPLETK